MSLHACGDAPCAARSTIRDPKIRHCRAIRSYLVGMLTQRRGRSRPPGRAWVSRVTQFRKRRLRSLTQPCARKFFYVLITRSESAE